MYKHPSEKFSKYLQLMQNSDSEHDVIIKHENTRGMKINADNLIRPGLWKKKLTQTLEPKGYFSIYYLIIFNALLDRCPFIKLSSRSFLEENKRHPSSHFLLDLSPIKAYLIRQHVCWYI